MVDRIANRRDCTVQIKVTLDERELLKRAAEKENRALSDWGRLMLLEIVAEKHGERAAS